MRRDDEPAFDLPRVGTVERWAFDYIASEDLAHKLAPGAPPDDADAWEVDAVPRCIGAPGRPKGLVLSRKGVKTPSAIALREPQKRAAMLHTFLHHELQAAELMCWALLAFPEAPRAFRKGLLGICRDEIRHMAMYAEALDRLGTRFGALPVNDWFWQRVPSAPDPLSFVSVMGLGFEAGNLDHAARFAARFEEAGDAEGARIQRIVAEEEVAHVRFGAFWFERLSGPLTFEAWTAKLPPPLSPMVMRGEPIQREARKRAGMSEAFVDAVAAYSPMPEGPPCAPGS
jgi:uncharacterized ferritin-like protein (DUF455 family)